MVPRVKFRESFPVDRNYKLSISEQLREGPALPTQKIRAHIFLIF